ncbi:DUF3097 domain-containing protein [Lipingzhangella sp. LS1_29]|uniref:DUF3097 domain-containing protein n=1 Tax=Lipingzhangella rawalii TaxID=2055835 RepID=A0ABU2H7A2_9ACTN|nr:DUF3097 domain-containing protein [Lipingzhangella rawalii]MDS1271178.1 DUF3097 domain-containing protein [Lipingzhangella rawalii]
MHSHRADQQQPARQYSTDVLAGDWRRPYRDRITDIPLEPGLVVETADSSFCGAVTTWDKRSVTLEDRHGTRRVFDLDPAAFLVDGHPVSLVRPTSSNRSSRGPHRSASGSIAVSGLRSRVARESRIYVEGRHDAELVERVWGHDLRVEGVVVEELAGVDDLPAVVADFAPEAGRRLGVLVDHLVPGSKESRVAEQVSSAHVRVVGHPFVDVWAAVRPGAVGISAWPEIPQGVPWKEGVLDALGWRMEPGAAWRFILNSVRDFRDLEPELLGRVEELIDFVTDPAAHPGRSNACHDRD